MDIEQGNIEILFQKINYLDISGQIISGRLKADREHTFRKIDRNLYMRYAKAVFNHMTDNECENSYQLACEQMRDAHGNDPCIFRLLINVPMKLLKMDGDEIECRFDQMLRWRELSFRFGQDIFTCAYLAVCDIERGVITKCFSWLPIIKSDDDRLHNILEKGIADNHFHLAGSTRVFDLNWVSLMNRIDHRLHDFKKLNHTMQEYCTDPICDPEKREDFYAECQSSFIQGVFVFCDEERSIFMRKVGRAAGYLEKRSATGRIRGRGTGRRGADEESLWGEV